MSERGVALCLNSSFLGFFAHAGFLDALTGLGVRPVAISGASAGALVAGAHAAGLEPRELIHWFLTGELIGRHAQDGETPSLVIGEQFLHCFVLRGETTFGCHIHHKGYFALYVIEHVSRS